jgi:hypothetical protein
LAIQLSPRSVRLLKKYAGICFDNEHFEQAADAYQHLYELAYNSIHHYPVNALLFVKSLATFPDRLSRVDAKKVNNHAFIMLSQMNKNFNKGVSILNTEIKNMYTGELTDIADSLILLKSDNKALELLTSINQQKEDQSFDIGKFSGEQLNENYADKAQKAITVGKELYKKKENMTKQLNR